MQKITLPNGLTVLFEKKVGNSVVIEVMTKVGSNNETEEERGISHFIEHMLFEGTKKRPNNQEISNEIEKIGGDFNAYTTTERTCFYVKVLKKHFKIGLDILSDIIQNSLFNEAEIKKEKNVVIKEIDLVRDEPKFYQWDLLQRNIFEKHPTKYPTYGNKKVIRSLTREKILEYFNRYYVPNNMIISVVGDVKNWRTEISKNFNFKKGKVVKTVEIKEPTAKINKTKKEKKDITSTYFLLGFKTVPKNHPDSYVLEVIDGITGRGQSGKLFAEIRGKKGLAYDVGSENVNDVSYGYFAAYATVDKNKLSEVKKMILDEFEKLKNVTEEELEEAKTYIEGDYLLEMEDPQKIADQLVYWEQLGNVRWLKEYIPKIKQVTVKDIKRVLNKYFQYYTEIILEGK